MTVGHCLHDHVIETKNNFDSVTRSLKWIEKDYHRARGCVLSPHFLLVKCIPQKFSQAQTRLEKKTRLQLTGFVQNCAARETRDYAPLQG